MWLVWEVRGVDAARVGVRTAVLATGAALRGAPRTPRRTRESSRPQVEAANEDVSPA